MSIVRNALAHFDVVVLIYFVVVNGLYTVLLASAAWDLRHHRFAVGDDVGRQVVGSDIAPVLSMMAPAYNEGITVGESVRALLTLSYPNLEIVVINDGSSDETLDVLKSEFALTPIHNVYRKQVVSERIVGIYRSRINPRLVVVDKENGGKADALNAGLNIASGELVCAIDADTLIEPDALLRMSRPFLTSDDVVAVGGTIRVANGCRVSGARVVEPRVPRRWLPGVQVVEYLRAFLFGRLGWNRLGGNLIISGAFGLFRRSAMIAAGGYLHDTVGEDMELVAHLRRLGTEQGGPNRVEFVPDPVAWTEVPDSTRVLGRQRDRWHRGLCDVLWRYRKLVFNPRYGLMGLVVYPYFVFVELLAPVVEALGLLGLAAGLAVGAIDIPFAVSFFLIAYGYGVLLSLAPLLLEEFSFHRYKRLSDRLLLVTWAVVESLGYRQLTVLWRLRGIIGYLRKRKDWGVMARSGFASPPNADAHIVTALSGERAGGAGL